MRPLLCAALLAAATAHAQLNDTEQRIVASVKQHDPAALHTVRAAILL